MLIGEYRHTIDNKKRISIPAKLRRDLGDTFVVTRGLDSCLFVYPLQEWEKLVGKLSDLSTGKADTRSFVRLMLSGASEAQIDQIGRMLIPDYLKDYAQLKKNTVIVGVHTRLEIWDEEKWKEFKSKAEGNADEIAERLGELGVY
jgi:MraZ protein